MTTLKRLRLSKIIAARFVRLSLPTELYSGFLHRDFTSNQVTSSPRTVTGHALQKYNRHRKWKQKKVQSASAAALRRNFDSDFRMTFLSEFTRKSCPTLPSKLSDLRGVWQPNFFVLLHCNKLLALATLRSNFYSGYSRNSISTSNRRCTPPGQNFLISIFFLNLDFKLQNIDN